MFRSGLACVAYDHGCNEVCSVDTCAYCGRTLSRWEQGLNGGYCNSCAGTVRRDPKYVPPCPRCGDTGAVEVRQVFRTWLWPLSRITFRDRGSSGAANLVWAWFSRYSVIVSGKLGWKCAHGHRWDQSARA